jgi:hypothetical protein
MISWVGLDASGHPALSEVDTSHFIRFERHLFSSAHNFPVEISFVNLPFVCYEQHLFGSSSSLNH